MLAFETARAFALTPLTVRGWSARSGTRRLGRIAAALNGGGPGIGSFGFLDGDETAIPPLLATARAWLAAQGMARIRGPLSFTINHEVGAQVAGFEQPPMLRMPRHPPWLSPLLEAQGLAPEKDVLACTLDLAQEQHRPRTARLLAAFPDRARLRIRRLAWPGEVPLLAALFNDAWSENWGFLPIDAPEAGFLAQIMAPIARHSVLLIAEWDGASMGVLAMLPNIEESRGSWRMLPALLWGRARSARIAMLGIARRFRGSLISSAATAALLAEAIDAAEGRGWQRVEISWILEDNAAMLALMARLPAPVTGRWRIHGAALTETAEV